MLALEATDITGTSAMLNGRVTANDNDVEVLFEYGLTDAYGTQVAGLPAGLSGEDDLDVSAAIEGLPPGTPHHYRVGARTPFGTHWSAGRVFTTLSDNARLAALNAPLDNLVPSFDPDTLDYIATVSHAVANVLLRPMRQHPGARVEVNGVFYPSPLMMPPQPLDIGANTITIHVTAEDTVTTLTYRLHVTRLPEAVAFGATDAPALKLDGFSASGLDVPLRLDFHPPVACTHSR